jgi:hypothetical protein
MKKIIPKINNITLYFVLIVLLVTSFLIMYSCSEKDKQYTIGNSSAALAEYDLNFALLADINESNLRVIQLTDLILNETQIQPSISFISQINKDHSEIQTQLKKLMEDNLIIAPKPIFSLGLTSEMVKNDLKGTYAFTILKEVVQSEIEFLQKIKSTTINQDFKQFATDSVIVLQRNQSQLQKLIR